MIKRIITILTLVCGLSLTVQAQSLKLVDTNLNENGIVGKDIVTNLKILNTTDKDLRYRVFVFAKQIGSSQENLICLEEDCFKGNDITREKFSPALIRTIKAGEVDNSVNLKLESGLVQGVSSITYRIENIDNANDFTTFEISYEVNEFSDEGLLYSSKNVDLSDVYPNPVTDVAIFDYHLKDDSQDAKIIIHNVLGSIAGEYQLSPYEHQLKVSVEQFNPGVYFYSLYIDNEGVATKKLVVRK
jgi:hypothetical protein